MAITPKQFEQLQARLSGGRHVPSPVLETAPRSQSNTTRIVIGIDPSLRGTGYGIIQTAKPSHRALAHGTIVCPAGWERSRCLAHIARTLRDVITRHNPGACAIEGLFYAQNLQTALIMGEARGAALSALGEAGLEIFEIAPRKVKQAIIGYGAAQKHAVGKMVQRLLQLPEPPAPDAADALAIALAYLHETSRYSFSASKRV
ncbi:MAG TPA: crossover junction endodeoxyribonuclease RuvC [Verrucomicrobiae bacterium]|jgi:crossover junction endodeoxyribonuclease RuvC|nr:crossover junction endodeoxyribonuclease RuvC [Verrucomicrobiae bacterium]